MSCQKAFCVRSANDHRTLSLSLSLWQIIEKIMENCSTGRQTVSSKRQLWLNSFSQNWSGSVLALYPMAITYSQGNQKESKDLQILPNKKSEKSRSEGRIQIRQTF